VSRSRRWRPSAARVLLAALAAACVAAVWCSPSKPKSPNVILIVVDALRPDYLGCYGSSRPTSPNIDRLAAEGVLFETAISHASWTKPSFSTMLTSLYPFQHGVVDWESVMPESLVTLPEILNAEGYATAAVINMLGITGDFKVTKGFEVVSEAPKRHRDAAGTTDDAIAFIREAPGPFFAVIHYFDAHWPRRPASEYVDLVRLEGDPNPFAAVAGGARTAGEPGPEFTGRDKVLYAACVRFVDDAVGRLAAFLDRQGLDRETMLIITADHGEAFWEHGTGAHGANLYDEVVRVPLIVRYPAGCGSGIRVARQVRLFDLLPTIVDFAGASDRHQREGTSLRQLLGAGAREGASPAAGDAKPKMLPADIALSETRLKKAPESKSLRTEGLKLIVEPSTALRELYDLKQDPGERVNVWGRQDALADSLAGLLARVPGSSVNGWRVALTGGGDQAGPAFEISVKAGPGARLRRVQIATSPGELVLETGADSSTISITSRPDGLQLILLDVEPADARVTFEARCVGGSAPAAVAFGEAGRRPLGRPFDLDAGAGSGLPSSFKQARVSAAPAVCVWWLPGDKIAEKAGRSALSAEAGRRLRSLGYVQ